jgi:hypothetical protein
MDITDNKFTTDKWYISTDEPYVFGELQAGLHLMSKRSFTFYDNKEDFESKLDELGIEYERL